MRPNGANGQSCCPRARLELWLCEPEVFAKFSAGPARESYSVVRLAPAPPNAASSFCMPSSEPVNMSGGVRR